MLGTCGAAGLQESVIPAVSSAWRTSLTLRDMARDIHSHSLGGVASRTLVPSPQQILQIFRNLPGPGTKSFTAGAYSVGGGLAGLRHNTKEFSEVTAMLCRYVFFAAARLRLFGSGHLSKPPHLSPIRT